MGPIFLSTSLPSGHDLLITLMDGGTEGGSETGNDQSGDEQGESRHLEFAITLISSDLSRLLRCSTTCPRDPSLQGCRTFEILRRCLHATILQLTDRLCKPAADSLGKED